MKSLKMLVAICYFLIAYSNILTSQIIYTVNSTDDTNDGVCNTAHCSFREAIIRSYADNVPSNIHFNIPGTGPHIIAPLKYLPTVLEDYTIIDGTTQPNYESGDIIIDGQFIPNEDGIWVEGNYCQIKGLHVKNFSIGILVIGDDAIIGEANKGNIFGNNSNGILINNFPAATGTIIQYNYFGTNAQNEDLGNYATGLNIQAQPNTARYNIFGFNKQVGVLEALIDGSQNTYQGNQFFCNGTAMDLRNTISVPTITLTDFPNKAVAGMAAPNSFVDIYRSANTSCETATCQAYELLGTTWAGGTGVWGLSNLNINIGDRVLVQGKDGSNHTSNFSACTLINNCTTNTLTASLSLPTIEVGQTYHIDAQPSGGTLPNLSHIWRQSSTIGLVELTDNDDGTVSIKGLRTGSVTLSYEVVDSEGCIFTIDQNSYVDIDCSAHQINAQTIEVVNTNDSGEGSLRHAINCANSNTTIDNIHFNLTGDKPFVIQLESELPILSDVGIVIDGTTQPNYQLGDIVIDGTNNPNILSGISIATQNCEIYGLHLKRFAHSGIYCNQVPNNTIIGALNKSNILTDNRIGISYAYFWTNTISTTISHNYIGTDENLVDLGNFWEGINIQAPSADLNLTISRNTIAYNQRIGVFPQITSGVTLSENSFLCNNISIELNDANQNKTSPTIQNITTTINGVATPNDKIELFLADETCPYATCQGTTYLGSATTDATGQWIFPTPSTLIDGDRLTATATDGSGNTSPFSSCFIVLPDNCGIATSLSVNDAPCSTTGIVLDLKQMTDSEPAPNSACSDSYAGKDAWYKVIIPETGNLLVRANLNNTLEPVIEAYKGDCGNLILQQCELLDSIPFAMVFENYTAGTILYLRVWDKENAIVDSENTALLHLTAHKLPLDKDDWEICDQENNLINGNPMILSERDAITFILEYDSTATPAEIAAIEAELEAEGDSLLSECSCNLAVPLQLWTTDNPIDLEDRRRAMRKRPKPHTPNYNYTFEALEFQVNAYAIGHQYSPDIAMSSTGDFALVWTDEQRGHNYARIYKSSGNPITQEFQVGASDKTQLESSIIMDDTGDFVIVWQEAIDQQSNLFIIKGRQYEKDGSPKGIPFLISEPAAATISDVSVQEKAQYGTYPKIAGDSQGNFIVTWHNQEHIYAQRFDKNASLFGTMIEIGVTTANNIQPTPMVTMNDIGSFIIGWSGRDADKNGIYAQRFSSTNESLGDAFLINGIEEKNQRNPDIVLSNDGSFIVVWESFEQEGIGLDYGIYGQRFNNNVEKVGNEFLVNTYKTAKQSYPDIALFNNGVFAVIWSSYGQDGYEEGIFGQLFDSTGQAIDQEFQINSLDEPDQDKPKTATNGSSILGIVWQDGGNDGFYTGVFGQRYEILENAGNINFYPISTATPSSLLGDKLSFPNNIYQGASTTQKAKVAIVDTGVDDTHPYLMNTFLNESNAVDNCIVASEYGYDFFNANGIPTDIDGHGTKINGVISRDFDNTVQLELLNLKFHEKGEGKVFDAICAIYYAVNNGAQVLNLSWGFEASEFPSILYKALKYAADNDVLVITTAGNTSKDNDKINKFPANFNLDNLIVVTAYEYKQSTGAIKLANYASYGQETVDIAAYGFVESLKLGGGLEVAAGTSLAAPAVVNTAATIKGLYPILTAMDIKDCILSSAQAVQNLSDKVLTGGILDHDMAIHCAMEKAESILSTNADCQTDLIINNVIASQTYHSSTTIESAGTIDSGNNTTFKATESITFFPGFTVEQGAEFLATIEACEISFIPKDDSKEKNSSFLLPSENEKDYTNPLDIEKVNVYPNPASQKLVVELPNIEAGNFLKLYDLMGNKVMYQVLSSEKVTLDISNLTSGMYVLYFNDQVLGRVVFTR